MTGRQTDRPLRVGLIGVDVHGRGFGSRAHVPGLLHAPNIELAAVCTTREESARAAAQHYGVKKYCAGAEHLLDDPDIDAVSIAVTVRSHYPLAWKALRAGKMVYCEWPLGLNFREGRALAQLAAETGLLTAVGTQGRHSPGILYMKQLIAEGYIGKPLFFRMSHLLPRFGVQSDHWWSATVEEHSGALGVACGHATDTLESVLGNIESVSGYAETVFPDDTYTDTGKPFRWTAEDAVSYQAVLTGGLAGSVQIANVATEQIGFRLEVFGEEGQITATAPYYVSYSPVTLYGMRKGDDAPRELERPASLFGLPDLDENSAGYNVGQAFETLREAWLTGGPFQASFADGYRLHLVIEAIRQSWADREWKQIPADPLSQGV